MSPRERNSERGWRRLEEEREETEDRSILELFHEEQPDEDAPLSRADDDEE